MIHELLTAANPASSGTSPGDLIKWILASVGLLVFLGATAQYLRGSADKGTITSLKDSVSALQTENGIIKAGRAEDQAKLAAVSERLAKVEAENQMLRELGSQAVEIKHLQETVDAHDRKANSKLDKILEAVKT